MEGNEISAFHGFVDGFAKFDPHVFGLAGGKIRIVGDDAHAEAHGAPGEFSTDSAHATDGEGFVV